MGTAKQLKFPFLCKSVSQERPLAIEQEWKVVALREQPAPEDMPLADCPAAAVSYWERLVATAPSYNPDCECAVVLVLNTRLRVRGHQVISVGNLNSSILMPREVFRAAIITDAHSVILMHNHPSGEVDPSDADRRITRRIRDAGEVLQIPLRDHVIIGHHRHFSFREAGLL